MKKLAFLLVGMVFMASNVFAQVDISVNVPEQVVKAFEGKYADASEVQWEQKEDKYKAKFVLAGQSYGASFGKDGNWMETSQQVEMEAIPATITSSLEADLPGYEVEKAKIVENPKGKFYKLYLLVGGKTIKVVTDMDGKIVKKDAGRDDN